MNESRVRFGNRRISIDGEEFRLLAGTMHYFRVPRAAWRDRMEKAKELGLNAIETYLCWNLHERREGVFNFSDNLDFEAYCRLAQELGLKIVLRPGPYICSEWDLGGLPSWLMVKPGIRFRRSNAAYLAAVDRWFDVLLPKIRELDYDHGGPVIAIQIENEYGSYGADKAYLAHLRDAYRAADIRIPLFTADGAEAPNLEGHLGQLCVSGGTLPDVAVCYNFLHDAKGVAALQRRLRPDEPFICTEFWCGWFNVWGQPPQKIPIDVVVKELEDLLAEGGGVIFYALCGGTDFYWTNGANGDLARDFRPMTTSYDFDALLTEDGQPTEKYYAVRDVLDRCLGHAEARPKHLLKTGKPSNRLSIPLAGTVRLFDCLDTVASKKVTDNSPLTFEELGTDFGYVFYRARIQPPVADPITAPLALRRVRDRATVFADGKPIFTYYRTDENCVTPDITVGADGMEVGLLVENMGRINFAGPIGFDFKGVCHDVAFAHQVINDWEMWCLPLDNPDNGSLQFGAPDAESAVPAFHLFEFDLDEELSDTFLKFPGAHGLTWLNGRPLGRYWDIGPDKTLYVPASWQRRGKNRLVVFETERLSAPQAEFCDSRSALPWPTPTMPRLV
jgi:beta-galactosidase